LILYYNILVFIFTKIKFTKHRIIDRSKINIMD